MFKVKENSACCKASVRLSEGISDFIGDKNPILGTFYYICTKCGKACDLKRRKK